LIAWAETIGIGINLLRSIIATEASISQTYLFFFTIFSVGTTDRLKVTSAIYNNKWVTVTLEHTWTGLMVEDIWVTTCNTSSSHDLVFDGSILASIETTDRIVLPCTGLGSIIGVAFGGLGDAEGA